ncbi:hypothetical protein Tco_0568128 [Tanacetum coccineum]
MAAKVSQPLEYKGGQLNDAPVLEVENFTNWKKRFMCHIRGIEPQFKNIIENGPYVPMTAGQRKPKSQWTCDERKAANLDQQLKRLILFVLLYDQMNSVINCLATKSTWDDKILYHEGLSDVKESRVMDLKLCYNTLKYKEGETLTQTFTRCNVLMNELVNDGIKLSKLKINSGFINGLSKKWLSFCQSLRDINQKKALVTTTPLSTAIFLTSIVQDFQDSPDDEEDTRSSQEYLNDFEEEYQDSALLAKSKRFFKKGSQRFSSAKGTDDTVCHKCGRKGNFQKPKLRPNKDFEAKYYKVNVKLALLSFGTSSKSSMVKKKGLVAKAYEWDEEDVSSDDNEMTKIKVIMALADDENAVVGKESARNGKWVKISMRKHVNTKILKENKNLRGELKGLTAITKTWLNSSQKVNQCISKQIPIQLTANLFSLISSKFSLTPPPKIAHKGKGISQETSEDDQIKQLMPLLEQGGSALKITNLHQSIIARECPLTIEEAKAHMEEIKRLAYLKAKMEKSKKRLEDKSNDQLLKNLKAKFQWVATLAGKLHIPPLPKLIAFEFPSAKKRTCTKRKRMVEIIHEVFVKHNVMIHAIHMNLVQPAGIVGSLGLVIEEPEDGIFVYNKSFDLDSLSSKPQQATSDGFKSETSSRKSKTT